MTHINLDNNLRYISFYDFKKYYFNNNRKRLIWSRAMAVNSERVFQLVVESTLDGR